MDATPWTLEELCRRCGEALVRAGIHQHNGQVTEAPNARAVRWYTSIGLLSRPFHHGRVALYGPRHLAQLVAIKRLQATGMSLQGVQHELLGKDDDAVAAIADVAADLMAVDTATAPLPPPALLRRSFWADDVRDADVGDAAEAPSSAPAPATRVALDHPLGVTLVLPPGCTANPALHEALAGFVHDLVARGLLATGTASFSTTQAKENER